MLPAHLLAQLHPTVKNVTNTTSINSSKKVLWVCELGHEWETSIRKRTINGNGCPYCGNKKLLTGFNDLTTTHPFLMKEWHPTKNVIEPQTLFAGTKQKVWWQCEKEHEWEAAVKNRAKLNQSCPICKNKTVQTSFNDLATTHPEIAVEWHPTKNGKTTACNIVAGSDMKVWWQCEKGHEWETKVNARTHYLTQCPYCSGKKAYPGFNDLASSNFHLTSNWHPTKNGTLTPEKITSGSSVKVWWVCEKGHEWETRVTDRKYHGCPVCGNRISNMENNIYLFLQTICETSIIRSSRKVISPMELDFWLPEKNVAIEFNGLYWHSEKYRNSTYHYDKWLACKNKGIQLIQVWEDDWERNPELVKQMLAHKLGLSSKPTIYARNTIVTELNKKETDQFLTENHIQGKTDGSLRFGLKDKTTQELVAVMVLKQEVNKTLNLVRFCTNRTVSGGFSKLLKHVETQYLPSKIVTFSDNMVSDGNLYKVNGFVKDKTLQPDYFYIYKGKREHKFNFRLQRFKNDDKLIYVSNSTEKDLAKLNSILKVWDAGKIKWVKLFD